MGRASRQNNGPESSPSMQQMMNCHHFCVSQAGKKILLKLSGMIHTIMYSYEEMESHRSSRFFKVASERLSHKISKFLVYFT